MIMPNKPSLSVGIPAYNQGKYLKLAIESLLSQSILPFEIVVSDNWSEDDTYSIAQAFGKRIILIKPPKHLPVAEHFNFLVNNLKGEWFSLLSCDDEALPNYVAVLSKGIIRSDKAVLVRAGYEIIDCEGNSLGKTLILTAPKKAKFPANFYEQLDGPRVNFSAFATQKKSWEIVGGFPESLSWCCDWGFWLSIAPHGDFVYQSDHISRYRTQYRPSINIERFLDRLRDELIIYQKIIPTSASHISNPNFRKIDLASKKRCAIRLAEISQIEISQVREAAIRIITPWVLTTNNQDLFIRVREGERIDNRDRKSRLRSIARNAYQWITSK